MAHALGLAVALADSNLTSLSTAGALLLEYTPGTPGLALEEAEASGDGGEVLGVALRNVTESCRIMFYDHGGVTAEERLRAVEGLFRAAERRQMTGLGLRVYVRRLLDGESVAWFSELLAGRIGLGAGTLAYDLGNNQVEATLVWTRRFYWEYGELTSAALTNGNGSDVTTGLRVWNHDDAGAGHDNWAAIGGLASAVQVEGVLPTPAIISLTSTRGTGESMPYSQVWLGLAHREPDLEALQVLLEASGVPDAACSGGEKLLATLTASHTLIATWTLSYGQLYVMRGAWFQALLRCAGTVAAAVKLRLKLEVPAAGGYTTIWTGPEVQGNATGLLSLGAVQLPPTLQEEGEVGPLVLQLYGRQTGGGSLPVDFVQLTPTQSLRKLETLNYDYLAGDVLWDDENGSLYVRSALGLKKPLVSALGGPLMLVPGQMHVLYLLAGSADGAAAIDMQFDLAVKYRQRRITL